MKPTYTLLNDRDHLIGLLKKHTLQVVFTKTNGETREMRCTLRHDLLPEITVDPDAEPKPKRAVNTSTISVFDLEKEDWRSFRVDSITSVEVEA